MQCLSCKNFVTERPCPICGQNRMGFFRAPPPENVLVTDVVQRTAKGVRHKKNNYAIFAFIVFISFEAFVILSSSELPYFIINWVISFVIFISGFYAISRIENYLRITTRNMFPPNENIDNPNQVNRRCNNCETLFNEFPCPNCGKSDARLIVVKNEVVTIPESRVSVTSNFLTKTNLFAFGILCLLFGIQWYVSFWIGGTVSFTISILMGLILFIPSYYMFFKRYFVDREHLV